MTNDEKILKALENVQAGQERVEKTVTTLQDEFQKGTKSTNRRLKKIEHSIELVLKYHDEMYIAQRRRIERLEEKAGISNTPHKN